MKPARRLLAAAACVAASHAAHADRSLDDVDVIEAGDCEAETAIERRTPRGAPPEREASIQFLCGIGWSTELAAAFARRRSEGSRDETVAIEAKTSLRERDVGRIGWALAYGIGAERGDSGPWRRSEHFVSIEATLQPARSWLIEARLGAARDRIARSDSTLWSLAVEHAVTEAVEVSVAAEGDDRTRPLVSVALRYLFWPERALVKLSYGAGMGPPRERHVGLGITVEF